MKRVVEIRVLCLTFMLMTVSAAWCQNGSKVLRQDSAESTLPDAPSVQAPTQAEKFQVFVEEARSPLVLGAASVNAAVMRDANTYAPGMQPSWASAYSVAVVQKESSIFFGKYLYPSLLRQDPRYHPSTSTNLFSRAAYAASRLLITRTDSGKSTVNTSYLLGVLTSAAVATAYRPYWTQSTSHTLNNFGSTIGSDAGINLLHEFWPAIRQRLEGHSPKFVRKMEQRVTTYPAGPDAAATKNSAH